MPQLTQVNRSSSKSRRRGEVLERALYEATLAELAEVGYGGLTMEGIAARARTGKAALYRRWCSKHDLVHAVWRPLVEITRWRHLRFRYRLAAEPGTAASGQVVPAGV